MVSKEQQQDKQYFQCMYVLCHRLHFLVYAQYTVSQWKHLVIITEPEGLKGGSTWALAAWFVSSLLCSVTWEGEAASSSSAETFSTYQSHNHSNYTTVIPSLIQWANTRQRLGNNHRNWRTVNSTSPVENQKCRAGGREKDKVQVLTFEGNEDTGCGQWVIAHWVP